MIHTIEEKDLPTAWAKAFIKCYNAPRGNILPMIVKFDATADEFWDKDIIKILNLNLKRTKNFPIETVRNTIFPEYLWQTSNNDRETLYARYLKIWPKLKKTQQNRLGSYFKRLIAFGDVKNQKNQLEEIIKTWNQGTHRKSALQATIFNPYEDISKAPRRGFPCLQQVVFVPEGSNGQECLTIVGFYASQDCFSKAFGNYWGLYSLGKFVAEAMGIPFKSVCCIASNYVLGSTKKNLKELYNAIVNIMKE